MIPPTDRYSVYRFDSTWNAPGYVPQHHPSTSGTTTVTTPVKYEPGASIDARTFYGEGRDLRGEVSLSPLATDATPQSAGAFLLYDPSMTPPGARRAVFVATLEAHYDDPQWIQSLFRELGTQHAAEFLIDVANPTTYVGATHVATRSVATVRATLTLLHERGMLTQGDVNNLVGQLASSGWDPYFVTEVIGKLSAAELKTMFVHAAMSTGSDEGNAAALHVLGRMSPMAQRELLDPLRQAGTFDALVRSAQRGAKPFASFDHIAGQHNGPAPLDTFTGAETLWLDGPMPALPDGSHFRTLPVDVTADMPQWRLDELQGRADALWLHNKASGDKVDFNEFGSMLYDVAAMADLTEREKTIVWTFVAHALDKHSVSLHGLRSENKDSYRPGDSAKHIVIGFSDGYHGPLAMLSPEEAEMKIQQHEQNEFGTLGAIGRKILSLGGKPKINEGDITASRNQVVALRAYIDGGFSAYARTWNQLYVA
jgi:hypothetical protein